MARRPRIAVPGVAHHVTQCGNNGQPVFLSPLDWRLYLELLDRHAHRFGTRILSYCLMQNHVHLVAIPEHQDSLARTLGRTHAEYSLAINRAENRSGHLWQNRFFSCPLEGPRVRQVMGYVETNPVRAGVARAPWDWPWSSAATHIGIEAHSGDGVLGSDWAEYLRGWNQAEWREFLRGGIPEAECAAVWHATRRGEPFGSPGFVADLERWTGRRLRVLPRGRPRKQMETPPEKRDWPELELA